jgi:hypothetical protein
MKAVAAVSQDEGDLERERMIRRSVAVAEGKSKDSGMVSGAMGGVGLSVVLAVVDTAASIVASVKGEGASSMPAM